MLDRKASTVPMEFFKFLLDLEGKLAMRYLYYVSVLDLELDSPELDANLAQVCDLIRKKVRGTDLIGRRDFQRFCIILPFAEAKDALKVAERVRGFIEKDIYIPKTESFDRTISIGGACLPTHAANMDQLINTAGQMLLMAKQNGGNRVNFPEL